MGTVFHLPDFNNLAPGRNEALDTGNADFSHGGSFLATDTKAQARHLSFPFSERG
ncbi:MAG: hypothetical protein JO340_17380 [Acidobacteriaceae bacterium]|nr:hypothetical protein [Acidobacteriaceae bacterium]